LTGAIVEGDAGPARPASVRRSYALRDTLALPDRWQDITQRVSDHLIRHPIWSRKGSVGAVWRYLWRYRTIWSN